MTWLWRGLAFVVHAVLASLMHHLATVIVTLVRAHARSGLAAFVLTGA